MGSAIGALLGGHIEALTSRFGVKYQEALLGFFDVSLAVK